MAEQSDESQALETLRRYRAPEVVCGYLELQGTDIDDEGFAVVRHLAHRLVAVYLDRSRITEQAE